MTISLGDETCPLVRNGIHQNINTMYHSDGEFVMVVYSIASRTSGILSFRNLSILSITLICCLVSHVPSFTLYGSFSNSDLIESNALPAPMCITLKTLYILVHHYQDFLQKLLPILPFCFNRDTLYEAHAFR